MAGVKLLTTVLATLCLAMFVLSADIDVVSFRQKLIDCMNRYRDRHQVGPFHATGDLTNLAQDWAQHLSDTNDFQHRGGVGENLWAYWHSADVPPAAEAACEDWYKEEPDYDYNSGEPKALHFTAMVWKATTDVGVGVANRDGNYYVVADFAPTGNVIGQFKDNVFPPKN